MKEEFKQIIEARLARTGLRMTKRISGGGLFSSSTYDDRTVYSWEDLQRLNREGFVADVDIGAFIWNAFLG